MTLKEAILDYIKIHKSVSYKDFTLIIRNDYTVGDIFTAISKLENEGLIETKNGVFNLVEHEILSDSDSDIKQNIISTISDLCTDFLYYDRKEDEELSAETLNNAVKNGVITINEMVEKFRSCLEKTFNDL